MLPSRRAFLHRIAAVGLCTDRATRAAIGKKINLLSQQDKSPHDVRDFFSKLVYSHRDVEDWLAERRYPFNRYDAELGYLLRNARFQDGIGGSTSTYTYVGRGERKMINCADRPCRINTYGDSLTECHQVSDGETWQEILAAHFGEPIRNYGIGGYSVYQAYLRMLREEEKKPARYIIFNIYLNDHIRTLVPWEPIRLPKTAAAFRFRAPKPHITVDLATGECTRKPNPCPTEESLYNLCDVDWLIERFANDLAAKWVMGSLAQKPKNPDAAYRAVIELDPTDALNTPEGPGERADLEAVEIVHRAGMIASMKIVEWVEDYTRKNNKKVLYVLSYLGPSIVKYLRTNERWDRKFVEFMKSKGVAVVDLMEAHEADYANFKGTPEDYVKQYFIGHYNPRGNFFQAFALREQLVKMLDPRPPAYQAS